MVLWLAEEVEYVLCQQAAAIQHLTAYNTQEDAPKAATADTADAQQHGTLKKVQVEVQQQSRRRTRLQPQLGSRQQHVDDAVGP